MALGIKREALRLEPRLWNVMCYLEEESYKDFLGDIIVREYRGVDLEITRLEPWKAIR